MYMTERYISQIRLGHAAGRERDGVRIGGGGSCSINRYGTGVPLEQPCFDR